MKKLTKYILHNYKPFYAKLTKNDVKSDDDDYISSFCLDLLEIY